MGYVGAKPSAVPLTSADITDGIITSAKIANDAVVTGKIADGTIVNADINASAAIVASKLSGVGITLGTEVASTSGTSIDFTGLPSTVKIITVMFNGVSTSGTSLPLIQIGSGSVTTTGYTTYSANSTGAGFASNTNGFLVTDGVTATSLIYGTIVLNLISSNTFIASGEVVIPNKFSPSAGKSPALGGSLDRIRITTANGTDTFDAGTININYQ